MPQKSALKLLEPEVVKQASGHSVKVTARAEMIHMIKTEMNVDICPVIGTEEQSEAVASYLCGELDGDPEKVLEYSIFGKSIGDMINDGINQKLENLPDGAREKLGNTIERVVNEGARGLICILL
jgi:stage IV sporulation protein A